MRRRRHLTLPLVESWFDFLPPAAQMTARALHEIVMAAEPELQLTLRSGNLVYLVDDTHAMALAPHRGHMHLQVFDAAALGDAFPELEGAAKGLRQLRLRHGQPFDVDLVGRLARAVIVAVQARRDSRGLQ